MILKLINSSTVRRGGRKGLGCRPCLLGRRVIEAAPADDIWTSMHFRASRCESKVGIRGVDAQKRGLTCGPERDISR